MSFFFVIIIYCISFGQNGRDHQEKKVVVQELAYSFSGIMETSAFSCGDGFSCQSLPTASRGLEGHHPFQDCSEEKSITLVEVEVRSPLQVPLQMSIIAGLREIGMDPQPIIDEAIRSEVEEKLGVVLAGTDTPIRWLDNDDADPSSSSTNVTEVKGVKGTSSPSAPRSFHQGHGGAPKRRAILELDITQLGPQAHLLQKNFLYHLANQISALHEVVQSIDPGIDLGGQSRTSSSSVANPGEGEEMKNVIQKEKANSEEEEKDGKTTCTSKSSYDSLFKVLEDVKKISSEMLGEIVKHDREVSALASIFPTNITSCCSSLPSHNASPSQKINAEKEKGGEQECSRAFIIPPVSPFMCKSLDDDPEMKKKIWREERKVNCLEDERVCSIGGPACFSAYKNNNNHDNSNAKENGNAVMTEAPLESERSTDSDSEAEYRLMGYTRL